VTVGVSVGAGVSVGIGDGVEVGGMDVGVSVGWGVFVAVGSSVSVGVAVSVRAEPGISRSTTAVVFVGLPTQPQTSNKTSATR
jgi:hypothetical protein